MRAIAVAISHLPERSEIRMVERMRGAIPAPVLEKERPMPTEADSQVLNSVQFTNGKCYMMRSAFKTVPSKAVAVRP